MLGGQQNKGKGAGCAATGLTGLTGSSWVLQNKSKSKMVKPKNPRLVFGKPLKLKAVESIQKEKPKHANGKLPSKSSKQKEIKHASWPKYFKQTPKHQVHHQNRQWNNFSTSMPLPSYGSPMNMPWGIYFNMPYFLSTMIL